MIIYHKKYPGILIENISEPEILHWKVGATRANTRLIILFWVVISEYFCDSWLIFTTLSNSLECSFLREIKRE